MRACWHSSTDGPFLPRQTHQGTGEFYRPSAKVGRSAARGTPVASREVAVGAPFTSVDAVLMLVGLRLAAGGSKRVGHTAGRAVQAIVEGEDDGK